MQMTEEGAPEAARETEAAADAISVEPILWWSFSKTRTRSRAWSFGRGICPICAAEVSRVRAG